MNKVGIYFAYWERNWIADYCEYIRKVKELGFDVLEIAAGSLIDLSPNQLKAIAECALETGIDLTYCIGLPKEYDVASQDERIRQNGIQFIGKLLDIIHIMGGDTIGGIIYSCWPLTSATYDFKMAAREKSILSVKEISKKAEDYGINYCLEIVNRFEQCLLNTAREGVSFVEEVGCPKVKLLLDTFHMNIEEDTFRDAILTAGDKIGHFHIGECNRKVPGKGHMNWNEIMTALNEINYQGKIVMEPFLKPGGEVGRDIKIYRDLSDGAGETEMDAMAVDALKFIRSYYSA
jgi:D-psicose/D-tagatose/L-ribulose 3-epimerase